MHYYLASEKGYFHSIDLYNRVRTIADLEQILAREDYYKHDIDVYTLEGVKGAQLRGFESGPVNDKYYTAYNSGAFTGKITQPLEGNVIEIPLVITKQMQSFVERETGYIAGVYLLIYNDFEEIIYNSDFSWFREANPYSERIHIPLGSNLYNRQSRVVKFKVGEDTYTETNKYGENYIHPIFDRESIHSYKGRIMIPIELVSGLFDVEWSVDYEDYAYILKTRKDEEIKLYVGSKYAIRGDGTRIDLGVEVTNGPDGSSVYTYVPLSGMTKLFGVPLVWDEKTQTATLMFK